MIRSKAVLTWWFRGIWGDDPTIRRINSLKGCRYEQSKSGIPVFFTRKARLL